MQTDTIPTSPNTFRGRDLIRLVRPHHWVKNFLVFVPLLLSHQPEDASKVRDVLMAFACLCLCASAGYVVNDWRDLESDRHHARKRNRPMASGAVKPDFALVLALMLLLIGAGISLSLLPMRFSVLLGVYVVATLMYSLWLKRKLLVDVFFLAGLYSLRLLAGAEAMRIVMTPWLLAFSTFFFLSLAFAKRYIELSMAANDDDELLKGRRYRKEDMEIMQVVGPASGYCAILVMAIYINSDLAQQRYRRPELLWLVCPLMLYWITRVWFLARRRTMHDDPIVFALKDRVSWITGLITIALVALAVLL